MNWCHFSSSKVVFIKWWSLLIPSSYSLYFSSNLLRHVHSPNLLFNLRKWDLKIGAVWYRLLNFISWRLRNTRASSGKWRIASKKFTGKKSAWRSSSVVIVFGKAFSDSKSSKIWRKLLMECTNKENENYITRNYVCFSSF